MLTDKEVASQNLLHWSHLKCMDIPYQFTEKRLLGSY